MSSITSSSHTNYQGRLFIVTSSDSTEERETFLNIKNILANRGGGWEAKEIKIENKKHLRSAIEELVPKDRKLQTPCLFINSDYIGTIDDLEQYASENDLKHVLLSAKQQDPGPLLAIYRSQNDIVSLKPSRLYFPNLEESKVISHLLKLTNLSDTQYVIFKMKTNNYKPYSVHPRQGVIPPGEEITITVHLKENFKASPSDKFRLEGVKIPYADESYSHEIDKIFMKLREKIVKQLVPLDLKNCPEDVVVEDTGNSIQIVWKPKELGESQSENQVAPNVQSDLVAPSQNVPSEKEEISTPSQPDSQPDSQPVSQPDSQPDSQPVSQPVSQPEPQPEAQPVEEIPSKLVVNAQAITEETTDEAQLSEVEDNQKDVEKLPEDNEYRSIYAPPETQEHIEEEETKKVGEDIPRIDSVSQETDEQKLKNLTVSTKDEVKDRELKSDPLEIEKQLYKSSLENIRKDYNKSLEEISRLLNTIQTLENEKENIKEALDNSLRDIAGLKDKLRDQDGLRQRKVVEKEPKSVPAEQKSAIQQPTKNGFPLLILCLVAIVCFVLGNIMS